MALDVSLPEFKRSLGEQGGRRLVTAALVLLALASALAWALVVRRMQAASAPPTAVAAPALPMPGMLGVAELARALGRSAPAPEFTPAQRFVLLGVLARPSGRGAALIAVDGAPPRPFAVGAELAPGFVLQRLAPREVLLGESAQGPVKLSLPLPDWEPPSRSAAAPPPGPELPAESTSAQPGRRGDQGGP